MKEKDREEIRQLIREGGLTPKQEVKKAGGNGHKTNWLQLLKDHLTDLKGAGWVDQNLTTMDGILDTITGHITADYAPAQKQIIDDWADAGRLDALLDAIKGSTDDWLDAGRLDAILDTINGHITADYAAAQKGVLDDWIDAGRLDAILDDVVADTNELELDWKEGGRLDLLIDAIKGSTDDWLEGGRLDLLLDAIKAITDTLTLQAIEDEAIDALESFDLDHLLKVALGDGLNTFVGNDTVLGHLFAKADVANYDRTTMSLEALQLAIAAIAGVNTYQEDIPDTDFDLDTIPEDLAANPPDAPAVNSVVDIDVVEGATFVLRSLFVNVNGFGTGGNKLTFKLWTLLNTAVTEVDSVDVDVTGFQNLMDLFGLQEVHGDGIWITVQSDATPGSDDADCEGTYRYAKANA